MASLADTILTDCLGIAQPVVRLAAWDQYSRVDYYLCESTVDAVSRRWESAEQGLDWAAANGFDAQPYRDGYNRPCWVLTHRATLAEDARRKAQHRAIWDQASPCYVRYGKLPVGGHSTNNADGRREAGVSVFRGKYRQDLGLAIAIPEHTYELGTWLHLQTRPMYIVDGEEIGTGSDGEPLITNARIVAEIHCAEDTR